MEENTVGKDNMQTDKNDTNKDKKNPFLDIKDIEQAENLITRYMRDFPNDSDGAEAMLDEILSALQINNFNLLGNADVFHNFSVTIKKVKKDNQDAYNIIKIGLQLHPQNTDLLADALQYGSNCGENEECKAFYDKLKAIDKKWWTWRGFSFSIDYLLNQYSLTHADDDLIAEMIEIADEYIKRLPYEEDAWLSKSQIYKSTNRIDEAIKTLEEAISLSKAGPRCLLEYADIMYDRGDFEVASRVLNRMRKDPRSSKSINTAYMYYLDALCKMSLLMSKPEYEEGEIEEKEVIKIYRAFNAAISMPGLRENISRDIAENLTRLEVETDIKDPFTVKEKLHF